MILSGINTFSLIDYPGKMSCIVFTSGCNMRCLYCHNKEFVLPEYLEKNKSNIIPEEAIFNFLEKRKGFLDGVSICGGEPTLHKDLPNFCRKIKEMGYQIKLDTNGTNPTMIQELIEKNLVDYIAMDIKQSFEEYESLIGVKINTAIIESSIKYIMDSGKDYEFRTTISKGIHNFKNIEIIAKKIEGAKRYFLQNFKGGSTLDDSFLGESFSKGELSLIQDLVKKYVPNVGVRY